MKRHASLNRVYRLVWNEVLQAWVAVAEIARGRGKSSAKKLVAAMLAVGAISGVSAHAAPVGGVVTAGSAVINQAGNTTTIHQNSGSVSINWSGFNIAPAETVNFIQPSASSVAVNRIYSTNGTQILGHLDANGQVWLLDPNGILFGQGAQVNVGGLVASTLSSVSMNGNAASFSGNGTGSIINQGSLNGKYIALIGNTVSNQGTIAARLGTVALGAGNAVTLTFAGDNLVQMRVDQSVLNSLAQNGGLIQANGGYVIMSAGAKNALLASVVNNTGVIEAQTVNNQNGVIDLLGGMGAGTVNVGGTLDASAPNGGNGGNIETSAHQVSIANNAAITTKAANGLNGSWLIDPADFTIAPTATGTVSSGTPSGDISGATLDAALGNGSVTILSSQGSTSNGSGNINVDDTVSWSANTLTLTAANNVNVNAVMTATGTAALTVNTATANGGNAAVAGGTLNMGLSDSGTFTGRIDDTSTGALTINNNVFTILSNQSGLQGMSTSGNYALGSNITINNTYSPIGSFSGTLDGLGHGISGISISGNTNYANGLIEQSTGVIRNLAISGSVTGGSANQSVGGLVGANYGAIYNVSANMTVSGEGDVGGLVGYNSNVQQTGSGTTTNTIGSIANAFVIGSVTGTVFTGTNGTSTYYIANAGGLVGQNLGTVRYGLAKVTVNGVGGVGGLIGSNYGAVSYGMATGNVTGAAYTGNYGLRGYVGGLVGNNGSGTPLGGTLVKTGSISTGAATGTVTATNGAAAGGLVGQNSGPNSGNTAPAATIQNSYASGNVSETASVNSTNNGVGINSTPVGLGGLVGLNSGSITNAYATGSVTANLTQTSSAAAGFIGGLVGANYGSSATITNAYATGAVNETVGGAYTGYFYAGGLVGVATAGSAGSTISQTYSIGNVTGTAGLVTAGALIGGTGAISVNGSTLGGPIVISNSYWDSSTAGAAVGVNNSTVTGGASTLSGVAALTTTQMQTATNFTGFTFTTTPGAQGNNWVMVDTDGSLNNAGGVLGATFPMLASEYSTMILNAHQLQLMAMAPAASYTLGMNINAANTNTASSLNDVWSTAGGFVPVGNGTTNFTGVFNGQGYAISNLTINMPASNGVGLFGIMAPYSLVHNVGLLGGSISGGNYVGGLVGDNVNGYINNVYTTDNVTGANRVGGLAGLNGQGFISNVYATGSVNGGSAVGGLVGLNEGNISDAYATGHVSGSSNIGGLVGQSPVGTISNSFYDNQATGQTQGIGGIADVAGSVMGMSTANMQNSANFISPTTANGNVNPNWDFSTPVWGLVAGQNSGYPVLCAMTAGCVSLATPVYIDPASGSSVYGTVPTFTYSLVNSSGATMTLTNATVGGTATYAGAGSSSVPATTSNVGTYSFNYLSGLSLSGTNAGSYQLDAYTIPASWVVTPLALSGSIAAGSSVYGSALAPGTVTFTNAIPGNIPIAAVAVNTSGHLSSSGHFDAGSYTGVESVSGLSGGADTADYTFAGITTGNYTVNPLALNGAIAGVTTTYGTMAPTGAVTLNGVLTGDAVSAANAATIVNPVNSTGGHLDAGSYSQTVASGITGTDAGNYTFAGATTASANYTVSQLALTGSIAAGSSVYGAALVPGAVTLNGALSGDNVTGGTATVNTTGNTSTSGHLKAGGYTGIEQVSSLSGADAANYSFAGVTGNYTVTPLALTGTIATAGNTYGSAVTPGALTLTGVIGADHVSGVAGIVSPVYSSSHNLDAGTYGQAAGTANLTGTDAGDYTLTAVSNPASYTVSQLALNGVIAGVTTTYGAAAAPGAVSFSNAVSGDNVAAASTATIVNPVNSTGGHLDAGSYSQTVASGITGADAGNYTFGGATTPTANYIVNQLALTGSIAAGSSVYGAALVPGAVTLNGALSGDSVTGGTATVNTTGNTSTSGHLKAGGYTGIEQVSSLSGADAANYSFAGVTGNYTVTPLALTGTIATAGNTYGSAVTPGALTLTGVIGADNVSGVAGIVNPVYSSSHNLDAGTYGQAAGTANLSGTDAGDYTLTAVSNPASYTVNPLALSGAIATGTSVYGATLNPGMVSLNGVLSGDQVGTSAVAVNTTGNLSGSGHLNAGSYTGIESVSGTLSGADAGNYTFTGATGNYTVNQAQLLYVANPVSVISGHPIPALSGTVSGVVSGDAPYTGVPVWATVATASSAPGHYAVTGSGVTVIDANYLGNVLQSASNAMALSIQTSSLPLVVQNLVSSLEGVEPAIFMSSYNLMIVQNGELGQEGSYSPANNGYQDMSFIFWQGHGGTGMNGNIGAPGTLRILDGGVRLPDDIISLN